MRKQIAAANWKMNCTYQQAEKLLVDILKPGVIRDFIFYSFIPYETIDPG